jgi:hypothetical protein
MTTIRGSARAKHAGLLPVGPSGKFVRAADLSKHRSSLSRRAFRTLVDFSITLCLFLSAILAWRSYGSMATQMTADLYRQLVWLAPRRALTAQKTSDATAVAASADIFPDQRSLDADLFAADREQTTRSTDQAAASIARPAPAQAGSIAAESGPDGAPAQPIMLLDMKPTEARFPPQTLSEKGEQLSAASGHESFCFPSASAVLQNHRGAWPTWTLRAPGHEGTLCWYAAARPRGSDHRPRAFNHRSEMMPGKEIVGITENGLSAPPARADSSASGLAPF